MILADGNTLSLNGSLIASTGALMVQLMDQLIIPLEIQYYEV